MSYVLQLTDATDPIAAGGKSANLGKLLKAGLPIPPGFVVTTAAFNQHLASTRVIEHISRATAAVQKGATVEELEVLANDIRRTIRSQSPNDDFRNALMDAYHLLGAPSVAVRSSATAEDGRSAAWAGQLESYLYITNDETLLDAVLDCWASLYTPRALSYRLAQGLVTKPVAVAVLIQMMVVAQKSGVAFTVDPVSNDPNTMIIEAVWGDCEQLVSGAVTPDNYRLNKSTGGISGVEVVPQEVCRSAGQQFTLPAAQKSQAKLSNGELQQLAGLCLKAESYFRRPQDIEWVYDGRTFYIVQARPITTLGSQ